MLNSAKSDVSHKQDILGIVAACIVVVLAIGFALLSRWSERHCRKFQLLFTLKHDLQYGQSPVKQKSALGGFFTVAFVVLALGVVVGLAIEWGYINFEVFDM